MKLKYLIFKVAFILLVIACLAICTYVNLADCAETIGTSAEQPEPSPAAVEVIEYKVEPISGIMAEREQTTEPQPITAEDWYGVAAEDLDERLKDLYIPSVAEVDKTAQMMPGEYNGPSVTERAQPVWCVCNRIDAGGWDFKNIKTVSQAINKDHFHGYSPNNQVMSDFKELAIDVYSRWINEQLGFDDIGRVLPPEFTFFSADKHYKHNIYRTTYRSRDPECVFYNGNLPSPYES